MSTLGLVAAFGSVLVSALGFVLVKRWPAPVDMLTLVSWQLVVGGLVLVPVGLLVEGAPPHSASATWPASLARHGGHRVAYVCWFRGLSRMPAGAVSLVGLVNPVVGTAARRRVRRRAVRLAAGARHGCSCSAASSPASGTAPGRRHRPVVPEPVVEPTPAERERAVCAA